MEDTPKDAIKGRPIEYTTEFSKYTLLIVDCRCSESRACRDYKKAHDEGWKFIDPPIGKYCDYTHTIGSCPKCGHDIQEGVYMPPFLIYVEEENVFTINSSKKTRRKNNEDIY